MKVNPVRTEAGRAQSHKEHKGAQRLIATNERMKVNPVLTEAGRAQSHEEHKGARRLVATNTRIIFCSKFNYDDTIDHTQ